MRSYKNISNLPAGLNLIADDLIEFHAARLLLLIAICGKKDRKTKLMRIEGLTKLAKLDFFIRYPEFLVKISKFLNKKVSINTKLIEARMIRFHYGPWDNRYYQILPFLEAKSLIEIKKNNNRFDFYLTLTGKEIASKFMGNEYFNEVIEKIEEVNILLGELTGTRIKDLIYEVFKEEVKEKKLGDTI